MAVKLSPLLNEPQIDSNGNPLSGGFIYWYLAGTTTPANTYTDSTGGTPQSNPVVLNTYGVAANPIWLTDGTAYKAVVKDSLGNTIRTIDQITGVNNSQLSSVSDWVAATGALTYVSGSSFKIAGDYSAIMIAGRRIKASVTAGTVYGTVATVSYAAGLTTLTLTMDSTALDSGLSAVSYSIIQPLSTPIPSTYTAQTDWTSITGALTYVNSTTFNIAGDYSSLLVANRRIKATVTAGTVYGTVVTATYGSGTTAVTLSMDTAMNLDSGLSAAWYGFVSPLSVPSSTSGTSSANVNGIINGCMRVAQTTAAGTLSTSATYGKVDMWAAWASAGAVSAGTITQDAAATFGSSKRALHVSGATLTGSAVLSIRQRIESLNAAEFVNQTCVFSAKVFHDVGSSINYTIIIRKPTAADNYTSTTTIGTSSPQVVATSTATTIQFFVSMGDCSNGIEIEIQAACGAITTKNFKMADAQFSVGITPASFLIESFADTIRKCRRYFETIYGAASVNAGIGSGTCTSTTSAQITVACEPKRILPTLGYGSISDIKIQSGATLATASAASISGYTVSTDDIKGLILTITTTGLTAGNSALGEVLNGGLVYFDARV